jgi:acid phosphatase family membrane protein YuiD
VKVKEWKRRKKITGEKNLREAIDHTPLEAMGGVLLGLIVAIGMCFLLH